MCIQVEKAKSQSDSRDSFRLCDLSDFPFCYLAESRQAKRAQGPGHYVSSGAARLFTTLRTPSTDFAVLSASSFSARDKTVPVSVTTPLSA